MADAALLQQRLQDKIIVAESTEQLPEDVVDHNKKSYFFYKLVTWSGIVSFFAILQLILLAMKLDGEINWTWGSVFTWAYIFLSLGIVVLLVSFVNLFMASKRPCMTFGNATISTSIVASLFVQLAILVHVLNRYVLCHHSIVNC